MTAIKPGRHHPYSHPHRPLGKQKTREPKPISVQESRDIARQVDLYKIIGDTSHVFPDMAAGNRARNSLLTSVDPEIRSCPPYRMSSSKGQTRVSAPEKRPPLRSELLGALKDAVTRLDPLLDLESFLCPDLDPILPMGSAIRIEDLVDECAKSLTEEIDHEASLFKPIGSLSTIAVIFGQARYSEADASTPLEQRLPFGLQEMGLDATKSLIWPFELHKTSAEHIYDVPRLDIMHRHYRECTWSILGASLAKVVLVCGGPVQANVMDRDWDRLSCKTSISLRGYSTPLRLEREGIFIRRVILKLPDFRGLV